jgi:Rrf2 family protein
MGGFDAKTTYALLAAIDLAERYGAGEPAKVRDIASRTGAPPNYLVHILLALKRAALVGSTRGARGGYWLVRSPDLISAAEVVRAVGDARARRMPPAPGHAPDERLIRRLAREADERRRAFLASVSLADLLRGRSATA